MTEMICGYEVVSRIAVGPRSEVLLARVPADLGVSPGPAGSGARGGDLPPGQEVVLKILGTRFGAADEVVAVDSVESDHVVRLRDISTVGDGRVVLVLEALQSSSLGDLLLERGRLEPGEAVTVLVSIARGLDDLHGAGWVHGSVGAANVLFRSDGTPVLVGLGSSRPRDAGGVLADRAALARLADALIRDLGAEQLARFASPAVPLSDVEGLLFDVAPAEPVRPEHGTFGRRPRHRRRVEGEEAVEVRMPGRGIAVQLPSGEDGAVSQASGRTWHWPSRSRLAGPTPAQTLPTTPRGLAAARVAPARGAEFGAPGAARLLGMLRSIRPRFWALGAGGAIALTVALVAVPIEAPASGIVEASAPSPTAMLPSAADSAIVAALVGDDPAVAALALIDRRAQCLDQPAGECVAEIAQSGSAFEASELSAIQDGREPPPIAVEGVPRVQRTGDAALVTFASAALLLVRTDAGWRLRDQFTASG